MLCAYLILVWPWPLTFLWVAGGIFNEFYSQFYLIYVSLYCAFLVKYSLTYQMIFKIKFSKQNKSIKFCFLYKSCPGHVFVTSIGVLYRRCVRVKIRWTSPQNTCHRINLEISKLFTKFIFKTNGTPPLLNNMMNNPLKK